VFGGAGKWKKADFSSFFAESDGFGDFCAREAGSVGE